jgi:eukaryotic translation initiation factor 2C
LSLLIQGSKLFRPKASYFSNVALKVNVKLGGLNVVPNKTSVPFLNDPANPTIIMGADAIHPPPGSQGRPSFTAVVGSVDTPAAHYVSACRPQKSGKEIIADMEEMTKQILTDHVQYKMKMERKAEAAAKPKVCALLLRCSRFSSVSRLAIGHVSRWRQ